MKNEAPEPRDDLIVIGVGNTLREDDGVGIFVAGLLNDFYDSRLNCFEVSAPDVLLSHQISEFNRLLIVDAMVMESGEAYRLIPVEPAKDYIPSGFTSHVFNWGEVLFLAVDLFGRAPRTEILGISAFRFGIAQDLSPACRANAEKAFRFLIQYCSK